MFKRLVSLVGGGLVAVVFGVLVVGVVPAGAYVVHKYESPQITEVPAGAPSSGKLEQVFSMTVAGGDLWVAESPGAGSRVDEFDVASGAFVSQLPVDPEVSETRYGVGVQEVAGQEQVYVGGSEPVTKTNPGAEGAVAVYCLSAGVWSACGKWTGSDTPAREFGERGVRGVAVDRSTSMADPAAGDVYVSNAVGSSGGVVDVFKPEVGGGEKYVTQIATGEGGAPLGSVSQVAVDEANGDVFVVEDGVSVDVFEPTLLGYVFLHKIVSIPTGSLRELDGVAVDGVAEDVYVLSKGGSGTARKNDPPVVDEFDIAHDYEYVGRITGTGAAEEAGVPNEAEAGGSYAGVFADPLAVAVDPEASSSRRVFVGDERKVTASGNENYSVVDGFGPDVVVPDVLTRGASDVVALGGVLNGSVNPNSEGEASCWFAYGTSEAFGREGKCEPSKVANGDSPVAVHTTLSDLEPDTKYFYRLQASNANGVDVGGEETASCEGVASVDGCFTTLGPGLHGGVWSNDVSAGSATLEAEIVPHGAPTTYYFEYGPTTGYGSVTRSSVIGSGETGVRVSAVVEGLSADTVYHYRVVVVSEIGGRSESFPGPDETFTTRPPAGATAGLPDGRQYELVSPADKRGAYIYKLNEEQNSIQAAADGNGIAYEAERPIVEGAQGYPVIEQELSTRGPDGGFSTQNLSPGQGEPGGDGVQTPWFMLFSDNLETGLLEQHNHDFTLLSEEASESAPYLWQQHCQPDSTSCFTPIMTGKQPCADVPPGIKFGGEENPGWFLGASPNLQNIIIKSHAQLTSTKTGWCVVGRELVRAAFEHSGAGFGQGCCGRAGSWVRERGRGCGRSDRCA